MSDDERGSEFEQPLAAEPAAGGQTAAASPIEIAERVVDMPSAVVTAPKAKAKGKARSRPKPKASAAVKRVEDVLEKDTLSEQIRLLKDSQNEARARRAALARDLRTTERRKSRLRKRARLLTDEDLLQVLMLRKGMRNMSRGDEDDRTPTSAASGLTDEERPGQVAEPFAGL